MIGMLRRRRLLVPVLFGTLLSGGCLMDTVPIPPKGAADSKTAPTSGSPQGMGGTADLKKDARLNQTPAGDDSPPARLDQQGMASLTADSTPKGKEAKTVEYISPNATTSISPYNPAPGSSGPAGLPMPSDVGQRPQPGSAELFARNNGSTDAKSLEARMQQLEQRLEQRDRAVRQTGAEVQAATEELHRTLAQIESWRKEVEEMRAKLRDRDREDCENLKLQIKALERMCGENAPAAVPK